MNTNLALNITAEFETNDNPGAINTYDSGIVSATRHQFTLSSGNLWKFITMMSEYHYAINGSYGPLMAERFAHESGKQNNEALRKDLGFQARLKQEATSEAGQMIADLLAYGVFYKPVMDFTCKPRAFTLPLSLGFAYDTAIQHGKGHGFFFVAEENLGFAHKTERTTAQEKLLVATAVDLRAENLNSLAMTLNLPGMRDRANFWQNIIHMENWKLEGKLTLKPGVTINGN